MDIVDAIEMVAYGLGAAALLILLLFLGVRSAHRLAGPFASGAAVAALAVTGTLTIRDAIRKRWTPASIAVGVAYALCLVALIAAELLIWE